MSFREADSARTENLSLYTSLTASRGKDFEVGEDDLPESNASETDIPALSSSFVTFQLPPLHEAAERGDPQSVARLLLDKSVDVNKKVGGHRAMRTALHRAAGYGHLAVVKLLLKAGADPMKLSSVHRTPLHEACTGGHTQVVEKLLQHMTDIDIADSNGQTAAHLAAYHGESQCLKVLISSGSNVTLEDKLGRSPAHLAAMKNHPSVLRCLIESDGELSHVDDQGRTPAHHAATSGGLEAIKALAHNDIDVNSRDTAGCVPAHYAAANNHCSCLGFLLGSGLAKRDVRDRTGRSLLHMAAQHGATECVHWLLECGASPNIRDGVGPEQGSRCCFADRLIQILVSSVAQATSALTKYPLKYLLLKTIPIDGSGATPLHSAASGAHLQSVSCLIKHGAVTDAQTANGDLPLDFAKRTGNPNSYLKAVNGEAPCKFCISKQRKIDYDLAHQPTPVERKVIQQESELFETSHSSNERISEVQRVRPSHSSRRPGTNSSNINTNLPKRDLATKYFGDHLFSLPVTFTGSESVTSTNRTRRKR